MPPARNDVHQGTIYSSPLRYKMLITAISYLEVMLRRHQHQVENPPPEYDSLKMSHGHADNARAFSFRTCFPIESLSLMLEEDV